MLNAPDDAVQMQLSDAISLIGRYDFPDNWPNLLTTIIENFAAFTSIYIQYFNYILFNCHLYYEM